MSNTNKGRVDRAKRIALQNYENWNNVTGFPTKDTSYYYEIQGLLEDAVDIGIRMAIGEDVKLEDYTEK